MTVNKCVFESNCSVLWLVFQRFFFFLKIQSKNGNEIEDLNFLLNGINSNVEDDEYEGDIIETFFLFSKLDLEAL